VGTSNPPLISHRCDAPFNSSARILAMTVLRRTTKIYYFPGMETPGHTIKEARTIGARKALKCTLLAFLTLEALILFIETRGDFANGILFFIQGQKDILFLSLVFILFTSSFFFGRWAGRKILTNGKKHIPIALQLTIFTWGILTGYIYLFSAIKRLVIAEWGILLSIILVFSLSIWASAAWSIKRMQIQQ
jgi:hypothetical protein